MGSTGKVYRRFGRDLVLLVFHYQAMAETLSIIIPAYNEGANIGRVLDKVLRVVLPFGIEKEIILVDDGSVDDTATQVEAFIAARVPAGNDADLFVGKAASEKIVLLRHSVNMGKGMAIRSALPRVTGKFVVIQDADDELNPDDLAIMLRKIVNQDLPVLYGSRFSDNVRRGTAFFYYGNRFLALMVNILYGQHITDEATCYKMFRTDIIQSLPLRSRGFEFCPEVTARVARLGVKIKEVPISYFPRSRKQGKKVRLHDGLKAAWYLLKYRFVD